MKLAQHVEDSNYFSQTASAVTRQLAFAGIAVIWIFSSVDGQLVGVPDILVPSAAALIVGLALDFLHNFSAATAWGYFVRGREKDGATADDDIDCPKWMDVMTDVFFYAKGAAIMFAYVLMLIHLIDKV